MDESMDFPAMEPGEDDADSDTKLMAEVGMSLYRKATMMALLATMRMRTRVVLEMPMPGLRAAGSCPVLATPEKSFSGVSLCSSMVC